MEYFIKTRWWKWLAMILLVYTVVGGFLFYVPRLPILNESIRALHFHVPMWFGMILLLVGAVVCSVKYLLTQDLKFDLYSKELIETGFLFGILGLITGMVWATYTWGEPWSNDPKQNSTAIGLLLYFAYLILRGSIADDQQKARVASVYNLLAFFMLITLLFIIPRMRDSLHPGNGGNPGFNAYDLDSNLRLVFYPAVLGWTLLGLWIATVKVRISKIDLQ